MAIAVKDAATLAKKFVARAGAAAGDYADGVKGAGSRWQAAAGAAEETWAQATSEAAGRKAFSKGIALAGSAHYEDRASTIGARRFPEGIRAAEGAWAEGSQPYLQEIAATTLSPRGPTGDPRNYERAREFGERMRAKKLAMSR